MKTLFWYKHDGTVIDFRRTLLLQNKVFIPSAAVDVLTDSTEAVLTPSSC